jgi:hypothetical protein
MAPTLIILDCHFYITLVVASFLMIPFVGHFQFPLPVVGLDCRSSTMFWKSICAV